MWRSFIAVAVGGALGCLFRWYLAIFLNGYFPAIPHGHLGRESDRLLHHRHCDRVSHDLPHLCSRMAAVHHHGLLRRPDDLLHLLGRGGHADAVGAINLRLGRYRRASGGFSPHDLRRDRHRGLAKVRSFQIDALETTYDILVQKALPLEIFQSVDLEERLSDALHSTSRSWRQAVDRKLKYLGVSQASWMTIAIAAKARSPLSQSELADKLAVEGATMVAIIDPLVKAGLVNREASTTDRRVKRMVAHAGRNEDLRQGQSRGGGVGEKL